MTAHANDFGADRLRQIAYRRNEEPTHTDGFWDKVSREVNVIGGGLVDGVKERTNPINLAHSAPGFAGSAVLAALMGVGEGKKGLIKAGCRIAGLAMTAGFVKDLANKDRLNALGEAIGDTWNTARNEQYNREQMKIHGGQFAFDTGLMMAGGVLGAGYAKSRQKNPADILGLERTAGKPPNLSKSTLAAERAIDVRKNAGSPMYRSPIGLLHEQMTLGAAGKKSTAGGLTAEAKGVTALGAESGKGGAKLTAEGSKGLPPVDVFPAGSYSRSPHTYRLEKGGNKTPLEQAKERDNLTWELDKGKVATWNPKQEAVDVRLTAQEFTDAFMAKNYSEALRVAIEAPVMQRVDLNPKTRAHEMKIAPEDLKKPEILAYTMSELGRMAEFNWQRTTADGIVQSERLQVIVPKPIISLSEGKSPVALVDFAKSESGYKVIYPEKTTSGTPLTSAELAQIRSIRQSPEGQRLMAETAIYGFEEGIVHANQHLTAAGGLLSPSMAAFSRDFTVKHGIKDGVHRKAFLNVMEARHPLREAVMEQEVPMLALDSGMPLPVVKHHFGFGDRHMRERTPIFQYLDDREVSKVTGLNLH